MVFGCNGSSRTESQLGLVSRSQASMAEEGEHGLAANELKVNRNVRSNRHTTLIQSRYDVIQRNPTYEHVPSDMDAMGCFMTRDLVVCNSHSGPE